VLRSAREAAGLSLEDVRSSTGVPMVDLAALEHGHLEVLHVEQAAVVGLWRYAELLGLDPGLLVGVVRAHWPRAALAVDAMRGKPGGMGMPCALLAEAEELLAGIAPRALALTRGTSSRGAIGLSEVTRRQLAAGAAGDAFRRTVLGVTAAVPVSLATGVPRPAVDAPTADTQDVPPRTGLVAIDPPEQGEADLADPPPSDPPPSGMPPSDEPPADRAVASVLERDAAGAAGASPSARHARRWSQLAHAVAERFGLDEVGDEAGGGADERWEGRSEITTVVGDAAVTTTSTTDAANVLPPASPAHA
ncbi:MAG: helix-turn-helix domain-containing protein, partial [Acidimicrobiales bacterium]